MHRILEGNKISRELSLLNNMNKAITKDRK